MKKGVIILESCIIVVLLGLIIWQAGIFGVSEKHLEQDARKNMRSVEGDWELARSGNEDLYALLFYSPKQDDYTYAVYLKHSGFSFGYFFFEGGSIPYAEDGIQAILYEDKGQALLSMNKMGISKIVADNGAEPRTIELDPEKPFAVVLPINCGEIKMYDAEGNLVENALYDRYSG